MPTTRGTSSRVSRYSPRPPSCGNADPGDFPFELDAALFFDLAPHQFAELFDFGGGRAAAIDQEITMHLRDLGGAIAQSAAAGSIDQLPGLAARRILESRTAGATFYRLRVFPRRRD